MAGFEPATPASRTLYSTKLSHIPTTKGNIAGHDSKGKSFLLLFEKRFDSTILSVHFLKNKASPVSPFTRVVIPYRIERCRNRPQIFSQKVPVPAEHPAVCSTFMLLRSGGFPPATQKRRLCSPQSRPFQVQHCQVFRRVQPCPEFP